MKITASSNGLVWLEQGHWAGSYEDWRTTRRVHRIAADQFAEFRRKLSKYRPDHDLNLGDNPACMPDQGGLIIRWRDDRGSTSLVYDFGCGDGVKAEAAQAIITAPAILGIGKLPGLN